MEESRCLKSQMEKKMTPGYRVYTLPPLTAPTTPMSTEYILILRSPVLTDPMYPLSRAQFAPSIIRIVIEKNK